MGVRIGRLEPLFFSCHARPVRIRLFVIPGTRPPNGRQQIITLCRLIPCTRRYIHRTAGRVNDILLTRSSPSRSIFIQIKLKFQIKFGRYINAVSSR